MKKFLAVFLFAFGLYAQPYTKTWTALNATGATAAHPVAANDVHTVTAIVTGGPGGCTLTLQGSLDGTNWFNLTTDQTCTSSIMFHQVDKAVMNVRVNLSVLSGGSSPTVTVTYAGFRSGGRQ